MKCLGISHMPYSKLVIPLNFNEKLKHMVIKRASERKNYQMYWLYISTQHQIMIIDVLLVARTTILQTGYEIQHAIT